MFDEREFHEIANGLPQLVAQRPEMEEMFLWWRGCLAREEILEKNRGRQPINIPRQMAMYCCQRVCGYAQQEVADCFSLTHRGGVSSSVRVIEEELNLTKLT